MIGYLLDTRGGGSEHTIEVMPIRDGSSFGGLRAFEVCVLSGCALCAEHVPRPMGPCPCTVLGSNVTLTLPLDPIFTVALLLDPNNTPRPNTTPGPAPGLQQPCPSPNAKLTQMQFQSTSTSQPRPQL